MNEDGQEILNNKSLLKFRKTDNSKLIPRFAYLILISEASDLTQFKI